MLKTLRLVVITTSVVGLVVIGCGDDSKDGGANLPPRNSGKDSGETNTSSSSSGDPANPTYDCSNHPPVDDDPQCDSCARAKCCEWITKCDGSPSCKAAQDCIGACNPDDFTCVLSCSATAGTGGVFLEEFGACVTNNCKSECNASQPDAGFDSGF